MLDKYPLSLFMNTDPSSDEGRQLKKDFHAAITTTLDNMSQGYSASITEIVRELNALDHNLQPIECKTEGFSYEEYIDNKWISIVGLDDWISVAFQVVTNNTSVRFLEKYSGESVAELIGLASTCRIDSIVLAFESAINKKKTITDEERTIIAVEALEREVNNGGYDQFFGNSSNEFASFIVAALRSIGCPKTAAISQKAVDALGISGDITVESIEAVLKEEDEKIAERLTECDDLYYEASEPIAERLFKFIKKNRKKIQLQD